MKRSILIATAVATLIWFAGTPALAQGRGHGGGPPSTAGAAGGPHRGSATHRPPGNRKSASVTTIESSKTPGTMLTHNHKQAVQIHPPLAEPHPPTTHLHTGS